MVTKIYKLELMVVDHENRRLDDIIRGIEDCKYIHPIVMGGKVAEIESWTDAHPLNKRDTMHQAFDSLFELNIDEEWSTYVKALDLEIDFS
jgi:hypothetical protein